MEAGSAQTGCGSFFCKHSLGRSDNERAPPRMSGSRTMRTWSDFHGSRRRMAYGTSNGFNPKAWNRRLAPQHQFEEANHSLFASRLGALAAKLVTAVLPLAGRGLPCL